MYVATTNRKLKGKVYTNYLIRRSYRENGKVKSETIANITHLPPDLIESIRVRLKSGKPLDNNDFSIIRNIPHGHVAAILQTMDQIGLSRDLSSQSSRFLNICKALIVSRISDPGSKLSCARMIRQESNSLSRVLNLKDLTNKEVYKAMDWLLSRKKRIENKLARRQFSDGTLILYDLTSSYYTGHKPELVQYGYNRDGKRRFPQIVFGLICNREGCPVSVEVFPGNTRDSSTFTEQLEVVRKRFGLKKVVWVGDRGMITNKVIEEHLQHEDDIDWITALKANQIKALFRNGAVQMTIFDKKDIAEITSSSYPGERLILCHNPRLNKERKEEREALLQATEKELDKIVRMTIRKRKPLRGESKIGQEAGAVINRFNVKKHFNIHITGNSFSYERNLENIAEEERTDGLYVIRTSLDANEYSGKETVAAYKRLSKVEWAFRSIKTTRLQVRPIYHWVDSRIEAHIFLCMLAYYVEWHMRKKLSSLLYEDGDKEEAEQRRRSPVDPAVTSDNAKKKIKSHKTEHGYDVQSFTTLIERLKGICINEIKIGDVKETIYRTTEPQASSLEAKALELMEAKV